MLDNSLQGIVTCAQFTGLGVFYTYFLSFIMAFNLQWIRAIYSAALGALLVLHSGMYQFNNTILEPKTIVIYGLFMQSFCSATLAACFFVEANSAEAWILQILPKITIVVFFISFYFTRCASMFYVKILAKSGKCVDNVSMLSWIVTIILLGFKIVEYDEYKKSLGISMIAFGFLHLSIAFFVLDKLPDGCGLLDHEVAKTFEFYPLQNTLKYEEHRTFDCSEGAMYYFRNMTNEKIAVDISFSNHEDHLTKGDFSRRYIRGRGHLKFEVKRGGNRSTNDRFFVFYAKSITYLDDINKAGFLTITYP